MLARASISGPSHRHEQVSLPKVCIVCVPCRDRGTQNARPSQLTRWDLARCLGRDLFPATMAGSLESLWQDALQEQGDRLGRLRLSRRSHKGGLSAPIVGPISAE